MERLISYFEDRDMFDFEQNADGTLTVDTAGKKYKIREGCPGVYIVTDENGKEKVFYPSEMEAHDYIIEDSSKADDRDIFYRPIKRFLLISPHSRAIIGSFDTKEDAQARADEINEYGAEEGDPAEEYTIIDCGE